MPQDSFNGHIVPSRCNADADGICRDTQRQRFGHGFKPRVVYCDSGGLLVVDKPFDLRVDGHYDFTLEKMVRDDAHKERVKDVEPAAPVHNQSKKAKKGKQPPADDITASTTLPLSMEKFRLVNQLDFATSGLIVLGLDKTASHLAAQLFERRRAVKWYLAVVLGMPKNPVENGQEPPQKKLKTGAIHDEVPQPFVVRSRIREVPEDFRMECVPEEEEAHVAACKAKAKDSATLIVPILSVDGASAFSCKQVHNGHAGANGASGHTSGHKNGLDELTDSPSTLTLVALRPVSGRRHQLRLHLSSLCGSPILGDATYGSVRAPCDGNSPSRMCLHSWRLLLSFDSNIRPPGQIQLEAWAPDTAQDFSAALGGVTEELLSQRLRERLPTFDSYSDLLKHLPKM
eukprot:TRINITY_DN23198_c0_g1_i1.p1 TRINITY_DN23198_c0_g1~~TRINITY_DN23198_c0_g1_i1.p1  ORF type:complete len:401 (-),score=62.17 TRINITY_DN23198_c0_g1_i1:16-1218(-)